MSFLQSLMISMTPSPAGQLLLKGGTAFDGYSFGFLGPATGEVVFNTGMVGYPETLTDPSYRGQILVLTYPLIGNYGVPANGMESDRIQVAGLIVSDYSTSYSHWQATRSLGEWLQEHKIPALCGVDTRTLTVQLRKEGVMPGQICFGEPGQFEDPNERNLVAEVSIDSVQEYGDSGPTILLIDCGMKQSILTNFLKRGVRVKRVPWDYDFTGERFDGLFISNGPGDPKTCTPTIKHVAWALEKNIPTFGICLGNQILGLAGGADTFKLKFGHRSQNQPCIDQSSGRCYITSQNHGYAVRNLEEGWQEWFVNANDKTNEGIRHTSRPFMGVQFHPEVNPGPKDTEFLFDQFLKEVKKE